MGLSTLRPFLQSVCCNSPWNYAVFWKLKHQHEFVLVWEDGFWDILKPINPVVQEGFYLENSNDMLSSTLNTSVLDGTPGEYPVELAVSEMSTASHIIGKGVVGEAALTGNAHWIYSHDLVSNSVLVPVYPDEWLLQFAAGIKTILLLPVFPRGVLQLGSVEMVADDTELVAYLTKKFESHQKFVKDWEYSIQQFSLMSSVMENLEESLPIFTEKGNEDQEGIHARAENRDSFGNPTIPMLSVQDFDNSFVRGFADTSGDAFDSEICWESLGTFQQSFENIESDITENTILKPAHLDEKVCPFPRSDNSIWTTYEDFVNELMDFHCEKGDSEPTFLEDGFMNAEFSLHKELGPDAVDDSTNHYAYDLSISGENITRNSIHDRNPSHTLDILGEESAGFPFIEDEVKHHFEADVANACSNSDANSFEKSNIASFNTPSKENKCSPLGEGDSVLWSFLTSGRNTQSHLSDPISSVESETSTLVDNRKQRKKGHNSLQVLKVSRPSTINKRRVCRDNQRSRPRDRQLIQDRIKELRDLIPNSEKSSIDGLLDRTIKHMVFLRGVTDQADKLRLQDVKEEADEKITKSVKDNKGHQNGRSWAVELGAEHQLCPIVVKDLDDAGHMIIEMLCMDHDRFLEIADVIHRLQLTILKGVMEEKSDNSWARFIVQASGNFHRLDIFWPLMQLL